LIPSSIQNQTQKRIFEPKIFLSKTVGALLLWLIGIAGLLRQGIFYKVVASGFLRIKEGGVVKFEA